MTREEAIQELQNCKGLIQQDGQDYLDERDIPLLDMAIEALSADAVSREEYKETDGVVTIEKQNANEVGEIKHIVVCSPNYTRYFYNESMPMQYKGGDTE